MKKLDGEIVDGLLLFFIVLFLFLGTYQRNSRWNNEVELWKDCVKKSPQKERTHHNLGFAYYELGQWEAAQAEFERALRLNPFYSLSMYNLGSVFYQKGLMAEAIDLYQKAIALNPNHPDSFYNMGLATPKKQFYRGD